MTTCLKTWLIRVDPIYQHDIGKVLSTAGLQIQEALQQACSGELWTVLQLRNFNHTQRWFVGCS